MTFVALDPPASVGGHQHVDERADPKPILTDTDHKLYVK